MQGAALVDDAGVSMLIDKKPQRIVIQYVAPLASMYTTLNKGSDELVAVPKVAVSASKHGILSKFYPKTLELNTSLDMGADVNVEALLALNPDLVFYRYETAKIREKIQAISDVGIKKIAMDASKHNFHGVKTFKGIMDILGQVLEQKTHADEMVAHAMEVEDFIAKRVENTPKVRALEIISYSAGKMMVGGNKHNPGYFFPATGLENTFTQDVAWADLSLEELYKQDPDIIILTSYALIDPKDFEKPLDGMDFTQLKAVKNKRVYKFPLGLFYYVQAAGEVPLTLKWLAKTAHPELFADLDLAKEMKDFYQRFYSLRIDDADVQKILNPSRESGSWK